MPTSLTGSVTMRSIAALFLGLGVVALAQGQPTADATWKTGTPPQPTNFSYNKNWSTNITPGTGETAGFAAAGSATVNLNGVTNTLGALRFESNAKAFTFSTGTFSLDADSGFGMVLINGSANQTLNVDVATAANQEWQINGATSTVTIGGALSGSNTVTKTGAGTVVFSGTNTNTGTVTVDAGTVRLGANDVLSGGGTVNLSGGTLSVNGNSDSTAGQLTWDSASTLSFVGGDTSQTITFDQTSLTELQATTGLLTITGWTGTGGETGAGNAGRVFINYSGPAAFVSNIFFDGAASVGAYVTSAGEIVAAPEPATTLAVAGLGLFGVRVVRRRLGRSAEPAVA
jgi:autotransporter-associated beta strand protein